MKSRPIVFVLTLWHTFVLLCLIVIFGSLTYFITSKFLIKNVNSSLERTELWINQVYENEISGLKKDHPDIVIHDSLIIEEIVESIEENISGINIDYLFIKNRNRDIIYKYSTDSDVLKKILQNINDFVTPGKFFGHESSKSRLYLFNLDGYFVLIGKSTEGIEESTEALIDTFLMLIPLIVIIGIFGGYFLTKRTLKPVNIISDTISVINSENLSLRVPERDVDDELGKLVKNLNIMLDKLEISFTRLLQFSSDASHELRTPFAIIRNVLDTMIRENLTEKENRELLIKLENEIVRASEIVDNLLLLNKIDQKKEDLKLSVFPLNFLFKEICEDTEILAKEKEITVEISQIDEINITADKGLIKRLLLNLVDNAVKFTLEKGKIELSLKKEDNNIALLTFSDTGIGIPQDKINNIFERFYRVDSSRSRESGGAGLGLSICKWIVDAHKGSICITSNLGKGTVVKITLPLS